MKRPSVREGEGLPKVSGMSWGQTLPEQEGPGCEVSAIFVHRQGRDDRRAVGAWYHVPPTSTRTSGTDLTPALRGDLHPGLGQEG